MAWNPNEEGNPAWLTKQASEHGGVENYINNIYEEGYQEGHQDGESKGFLEGIITMAIADGIGGIATFGKRKWDEHKSKKQQVHEKAEKTKIEIQNICNEESELESTEDEE